MHRSGTHVRAGTPTCPCTSVAEENVLMYESDSYNRESVLVHEFAHAVMNCGFSDEQRDRLRASYARCRQMPHRFQLDQFWLSNEEEFFAELVQAWFHATIRTDVNDSIRTRAAVKEVLPDVAELIEEVFGDGEWLYSRECACPQRWEPQPDR